MKRQKKCDFFRNIFKILALWPLLLASEAMGSMSLQVFTGIRSGSFTYVTDNSEKALSFATPEIGAALHYTPSRRMPFSLGFKAMTYTFDLSELSSDIFESSVLREKREDFSSEASGSSTGLIYGPEFTVWLPLGLFQPYLSGSLLVGTEKDATTARAESVENTDPLETVDSTSLDTFDVQNISMAGGLRLRFSKSFLIFGEYCIEKGTRKLKTTQSRILYKNGDTQREYMKDALDPGTTSNSENGKSILRIGVQFAL